MTIEQRRKATDKMKAKTNTEATPSPIAKGTVTITLYKVSYTLDVDKDLSNNIKAIIREANRGRKGYKVPAVDVIRERLRKAWSMKGKVVKTEFSSPETKGAIVPFALVCFG